jgi:hypothetical protein
MELMSYPWLILATANDEANLRTGEPSWPKFACSFSILFQGTRQTTEPYILRSKFEFRTC